MCWCRPEVRTPVCGRYNCSPPQPVKSTRPRFGATFVVPEHYEDVEKMYDIQSKTSMIEIAYRMHDEIKPTEILSHIANNKMYMYDLVVLTHDEYNKLKDYEWKYKDLQK